jgi:hypothetical protein
MGIESRRRGAFVRFSYLSFALSSFVIGGAMIVDPIGFWGFFGLRLGEPIVAAVYGGAIFGEGLACLWGRSRPARAVGVLIYMVAYKTVVVATLVPRLVLMDEAPWAGWLIVAAWGSVAIWAAMLIPWREQRAV